MQKLVQNNLQNIKILYPYMKPYLWKMILVLLIVPIGSFTFSVQPIIIQKAIDGPLRVADYSQLWVYSSWLAVMVFVNFITQIVQFWIMSEVGQNVVANARFDLFRHLEKLSLSFFDRTPVGRSVSRITSDMEQLAESFSGGVILIILDFFNIIGILIFMTYLNWQLSLVIGFFLIPILLLNNHYQKVFRESNFKSRQELSKLNSFLQQNIVGIFVVHALNSLDKSMKKFSEFNKSYFKANDVNIKADAQLSAFTELVSLLAIVALILIGMFIIQSKTELLSIGILVAFVQYTQSLFEPIRNLSDRFTIVQSAFTSLERINELKSEEIEVKDPLQPVPLVISKGGCHVATAPRNDGNISGAPHDDVPLIEFKNVWFKYEGIKSEENTEEKAPENEWVLQGINFSMKASQKVAFIGRTGSGKSTIIKLLTRLYDPQQGEILINGINLKNFRQDDIHDQISVIHQDSYIFAGNLIENIKLNRPEKDLDLNLVSPILDTTTLPRDILLSERASNISSGEQQVINFARALVSKPEIVVLDEATAKIDIHTEKRIYSILDHYLEKRSAIIIAHRLETLKHCDLVFHLEHGRIINAGSPEKVIASYSQ